MINSSTIKVDRNFLLGAMWIFLGAILFSTKAILVKLAYRHGIDSISLLALRMSFSLPFFLIIGFLSRKRWTASNLEQKDYLVVLAAGILGYYAASFFDFLGLKYVTAGIERLVLYVYPTLVLLIGAIFLKEKIKKVQLIALLMTYVGVAIAFLDKAAFAGSSNFWLGVGLVFLAALTYAIYIVLGGKYIPRLGTLRYTVLTMTAACLFVLAHHYANHRLQLFHFSAEIYWLSFLMAAFATVIPAFMISEGIRLVGSSNAAIIGSIGPISTIILAYFFLGEAFGYFQFMGTVVVIVGVLWLSLSKKQKN